MARTPLSTVARFAPCTINIRGKVAFSRIATRVEGQELILRQQQDTARGLIPHTKPFITITINNPMILNTNLPAEVVNVIQERFYTRQDGTISFAQESKAPFMPTVAYSAEAGDDLKGVGIADDKVHLPAELANGLDVTLGIQLYSKNAFTGLGLNYILINEPIKYYNNSALEAQFAAQGINYTAPVAQDIPQSVNVMESMPAQNIPVATPVVNTPVNPIPNYGAPAYQMPNQQPVFNQNVAPTFMQSNPQMNAFDSDLPFSQSPSQPVAVSQAPSRVQMPVDGVADAPQVQRPSRYY